VIAELAPPGVSSGVERVRLRRGGRAAGWFDWATVSADGIGPLARRCGFPSADHWNEAGRWFAALT
jgi:hypothetical protein